jgi:uncharacterized protein YjbI with pentapeptide repeats
MTLCPIIQLLIIQIKPMLEQIYKDLLLQTLDDVKAYPEHHNQRKWHCGTSHCFAGFADLRAFNRANISMEDLLKTHFEYDQLNCIDHSYFGLTKSGWKTLIHASNSLEQLEFFVKNLIENDGSIVIKDCTISLVSTDLRSANLSHADLRGVNLTGADLSHASLTGADLRSADMNKADLYKANLTNVNLSYADLRSASLRSASLRSASLRSANLSHANLTGADLSHVDLTNADLTGADMHKADLYKPNLTNVNLTGVNLSNVNLTRADLN